MSTIELTSKAKELKELKRMAEELAAEITAIEDTIKQEMTARATDELIMGEYKIRWKEVISNRFDTTTFKKMHTELYERFTKTTTTRRFTVA